MNMSSFKNIGCSPIERIRAKMIEQRNIPMTYSQISHYWGISKGTIWRIINQEYEPKQADIREALRLPELIIVPAYRDQKTGRFTRRG